MIYTISLTGKPIALLSGSSRIALYPRDGYPPVIDIGKPELFSTTTLQFENNLRVPVRITEYSLLSEERLDIIASEPLPLLLDPGETMRVTLRMKGTTSVRNTDVIIMHGSHEHLNSRYKIRSGGTLSGIMDAPYAPTSMNLTASPNPARGHVTITFGTVLETAHVQILDIRGHVVAEFHCDGQHLKWDGTTRSGRQADAGTYFIRVAGTDLTGRSVAAVRKIVLLP